MRINNADLRMISLDCPKERWCPKERSNTVSYGNLKKLLIIHADCFAEMPDRLCKSIFTSFLPSCDNLIINRDTLNLSAGKDLDWFIGVKKRSVRKIFS